MKRIVFLAGDPGHARLIWRDGCDALAETMGLSVAIPALADPGFDPAAPDWPARIADADGVMTT